jgi:hypothetical protein
MADQTMTVLEGSKTGVVDQLVHANSKAGNAAAGGFFRIPNDGKVVLLMGSVTGDTLTFSAVNCSHGRTETLAPTAASGKFAVFGPWAPSQWNQSDGCVIFKPTAGNAGDLYLAVRVGNPT